MGKHGGQSHENPDHRRRRHTRESVVVQVDYVVPGVSNARLFKKLPPDTRLGNNAVRIPEYGFGQSVTVDQLMSDSSIKLIRKLTPKRSAANKVVFLFDVDNTLLDNDRVTADLRHYLKKEVGLRGAQCYWNFFEQLRSELGYADYLGALQRYRNENQHDPRLLTVSHFLIDYPFADCLFPQSLDVVERIKQLGPAVILSDGDVVFQPRKVERSGLLKAVNGNVLIYLHKEQELDDVAQRFPADHYVMVDDKLRILTAVKKIWGPRVTTIFVRQGHYALDPKILAAYPAADVSIDRIGDLLTRDFQTLPAQQGGHV